MLLRRQVSEERDEHIDMTPMVDVVFQLMTFMLFTVQMSGGEEVKIPVAKNGVGVEETAATFLSMVVTKAGEPVVLQGNTSTGRPLTMEEVKKAVVDGLADGKRKVILQADRRVPHGEVLKVAGAVAEVENVTLHIGVAEAASKAL